LAAPISQLGANRALLAAHATVLYADPSIQTDPHLAPILASPRENGWRQVDAGTGNDGRWSVLIRDGGHGHSASPYVHRPLATLRDLPATLNDPRLAYYSGIYGDGWLQQRSMVVLAGGPKGVLVLRAQVLPRPGQRLRVIVDGHTLSSERVKPGALLLRLPVPASLTERHVVLDWDGAVQIAPSDVRPAVALLVELGVRPATGARS